MDVYGWDKVDINIANNYIKKCKLFSESDIEFNNFRQDPDYKKILEGGERIVGEIHLKHILENHNINLIKDKLNELKENDIYGNPTIMNFDIFGEINPCTILYISHALDICKLLKNSNPKRIVEIGGGFGGLCKTLSVFVDFEEYTLVDLPEAISLCKKYLDNFPKIKNKIKYVTCNEFDKNKFISNDLFIAIASLAECNHETQLSYIDILLKSNFGFVIYNTEHVNNSKQELRNILNLTDIKFNKKIIQNLDVKIIEFEVKNVDI